jgi:cation transport regulator
MPYDSIQDLPASVRDNLPKHAQEIYQAAYNNAWDEYDHDEETAHKVAWAAVKKTYKKDEKNGKWRKK